MRRKVWVEIDEGGRANRIPKGRIPDTVYILMDYRRAVSEIRRQIWERTNGWCEWCSKAITVNSMHMHEKHHRGEFIDGHSGEISLENSVGICRDCHHVAHKDRNPRFHDQNNI